MQIVAIGDIHGRDTWEEIVSRNGQADQIVFVGDYFDSFKISIQDQMDNFRQILDYKRRHKDKVILLMGNHDFHYIHPGERYSGYNDTLTYVAGFEIDAAIRDGLLQICHQENGFLFTHAGVTKTWLRGIGVEPDVPKDLAKILNEEFVDNPGAFCFDQRDTSYCGNDKRQSPIWVRPECLVQDALDGYVQIIGHTISESIVFWSENVIGIDALEHEQYLILYDGKPYPVALR